MKDFFVSTYKDFYKCFIEAGRYSMYLEGLLNTVIIALGACLIGTVIGIIVTGIRIAPKKLWIMRVLDGICRLYVTIIRGTPVVLQLFICYFVLLKSLKFVGDGLPIAAITFGINSGAYMAEILRGGITAVDYGQTEAGRALGLPSSITMMNIVIPQAIKNVIPAIGNELIALIKETSIVSMIGMYDLTMAAKNIGSGNYMASYIVPMSVVALFYLGIVYLLTFCIKLIEKRLRAGDKR